MKLEMTWPERYERMRNHYGWSQKRIAEITGNSPGSVMTVTAPGSKQSFPRWLRLAVVVFEVENGYENEVIVI